MNIFSIGFLDASVFTANLILRHKAKLQEVDPGISLLPLRTEDGDLPIMAEWGSAKALLSKVRAAAAPILGGKPGILARASVVQLGVGACVPWAADDDDYAQTVHRLLLCLIPSPGCWVYSGSEGTIPSVGMLTLVNHEVLHSVINTGQNPCTQLIVDVLKPLPDA